jgi:hypothetical protein
MKCVSAAHGWTRCPAKDWCAVVILCPEMEQDCVLFANRTGISLDCGPLCGGRLRLVGRPIMGVIHHSPQLLEPPIGAS